MQNHLYAQVHLISTDPLGIQKTFEIRSSGVGRIELGKGWRYEQYILQNCEDKQFDIAKLVRHFAAVRIMTTDC